MADFRSKSAIGRTSQLACRAVRLNSTSVRLVATTNPTQGRRFNRGLMYQQHPGFTTPPEEAVLWRYMDFTKFVSILDRASLFFCRADKLGDPFEGSSSEANYDAIRKIKDPSTVDIWRQHAPILKSMRGVCMVNCWHRSEYESDAMWKIYTGQNQGIAIRTDFASLSASFIGDEPIFIGEVNYINYNTDVIPDDWLLVPLLYKRNHFEHEREVRVLKDPQGMSNIPENGEYSPVDLSVLIQEVFVSPLSPDWFAELVKSVSDKFGLQAEIKLSALNTLPGQV